MTSPDSASAPDTARTPPDTGADAHADAPVSGVRDVDLPPPATDADADAENDDVSAGATSR